MKQLKTWSLFMIVMMMASFVVSCGSDDDDSMNVDELPSYLIGTWRSYSATAYSNGQSATKEITKTGDLSYAYYEFEFMKEKTVIMNYWKVDDKGLSHWLSETGKYSVRGDIVTIYDNNNESMDLIADLSNRTMSFKVTGKDSGIQYTVTIHLRK